MNALFAQLTRWMVALLVVSIATSAVAAERVDGTNVKVVEYADPGNTVVGQFCQIGPKRWVEVSPDGTFSFTEEGRDEWSVYLRKSDGAAIQLDLYQNVVTISCANGHRDVLYRVMRSAETNGTSARRILYSHCGGETPNAQFIKTDNDLWTEYNSDGVFTLKIVGVDAWSVYLQKTDGSQVQIDLYELKVFFTPVNGSRFALYDILLAD